MVGGFADGLEVLPFVRESERLLCLEKALRWGHLALKRSEDAAGYAEVHVTVRGVLAGMLEIAVVN